MWLQRCLRLISVQSSIILCYYVAKHCSLPTSVPCATSGDMTWMGKMARFQNKLCSTSPPPTAFVFSPISHSRYSAALWIKCSFHNLRLPSKAEILFFYACTLHSSITKIGKCFVVCRKALSNRVLFSYFPPGRSYLQKQLLIAWPFGVCTNITCRHGDVVEGW